MKPFDYYRCTIEELFSYVEKNIITQLEIYEEDEYITNKYSGAKIKLKPVQVALYDFIIGYQIGFSLGYIIFYEDQMRMNYSLAKDYFRLKWSDEYLILLD